MGVKFTMESEDDQAAKMARAKRLRDQIRTIVNRDEPGDSAKPSSDSRQATSPHERIERRMQELEKEEKKRRHDRSVDSP